MAKWTLEPGHTAAEFCVRHMMVTYVRGAFKDVHGTLEFDPEDLGSSSVEVVIDARGLWSGDATLKKRLAPKKWLSVVE